MKDVVEVHGLELTPSTSDSGRFRASGEARIPASVLGVLWSAQLQSCDFTVPSLVPSSGANTTSISLFSVLTRTTAAARDCSRQSAAGVCIQNQQASIQHLGPPEDNTTVPSSSCDVLFGFGGIPVVTHHVSLGSLSGELPAAAAEASDSLQEGSESSTAAAGGGAKSSTASVKRNLGVSALPTGSIATNTVSAELAPSGHRIRT